MADAVRVAWLNNEPDTEELMIYPARAGNWCLIYPSSGTACGMRPESVGVMDIGLGTARRADEHTWQGYLTAMTSSEVETVQIIGKDGTNATFATQPAPAGAPQCLRYLYVQFDRFGNDITVIGRDRAGREVAREHRELGVAPPPPAASRPQSRMRLRTEVQSKPGLEGRQSGAPHSSYAAIASTGRTSVSTDSATSRKSTTFGLSATRA